jgi:hypothetical protein
LAAAKTGAIAKAETADSVAIDLIENFMITFLALNGFMESISFSYYVVEIDF